MRGGIEDVSLGSMLDDVPVSVRGVESIDSAAAGAARLKARNAEPQEDVAPIDAKTAVRLKH